MNRNCLKCTHFLRKVIYQYTKNGSIASIDQVMKCTKLNIIIQPKNSEEKDNESRFIPSKCYQGIYFEEAPKVNVEKIICRDV